MQTTVAITRKERDKQIRRSDILHAAERIFGLKGYYQATIQDIAKEAQYATGTVYLYFKDKEELYFSLVEEKIAVLVSLIKEKTAKLNDAHEIIEVFIKESMSFFEKNQDFFRIFLSERSAVQLTIDRKMSQSLKATEHRAYVAELMKIAQQQNVVRGDCDPRHLADILISMMSSTVLGWLKGELREMKNLSEASGLIFEIFLNGARKP